MKNALWPTQPLGKLCAVKGGKRLPKGRQLQTLSNGKPYLRVSDISAGAIDARTLLYVPDDVAPVLERYRVRSGDLFISVAGTLGIVGMVPSFLDGAYLTENADRLTDLKIDPAFLLHVLRGPNIQQLIQRTAHKNAQPKLAIERILTFPIPTPTPEEQRRIAEILTCWDKAIELVEGLIEEYDNIYRAISRSLLSGTIRFTDKEAREHDTYKTVALSDIFERVTRKNSENCNLALTISGRDGLIRQEEYFNKRVASERLDGYYLLNNGEFAFNRSSMNGYPYGAIKRLDRYDRGVVSTLYLCFKLKDTLACSDYFALYFDSGLFNREIYSIAQEGARSHGLLNIGTEEFFNLRVPSPPLDAQLRIAKVIMAFAAHNKNLRVYRDRLVEQKRGLMQKLLTGKKV